MSPSSGAGDFFEEHEARQAQQAAAASEAQERRERECRELLAQFRQRWHEVIIDYMKKLAQRRDTHKGALSHSGYGRHSYYDPQHYIPRTVSYDIQGLTVDYCALVRTGMETIIGDMTYDNNTPDHDVPAAYVLELSLSIDIETAQIFLAGGGQRYVVDDSNLTSCLQQIMLALDAAEPTVKLLNQLDEQARAKRSRYVAQEEARAREQARREEARKQKETDAEKRAPELLQQGEELVQRGNTILDQNLDGRSWIRETREWLSSVEAILNYLDFADTYYLRRIYKRLYSLVEQISKNQRFRRLRLLRSRIRLKPR